MISAKYFSAALKLCEVILKGDIKKKKIEKVEKIEIKKENEK